MFIWRINQFWISIKYFRYVFGYNWGKIHRNTSKCIQLSVKVNITITWIVSKYADSLPKIHFYNYQNTSNTSKYLKMNQSWSMFNILSKNWSNICVKIRNKLGKDWRKFWRIFLFPDSSIMSSPEEIPSKNLNISVNEEPEKVSQKIVIDVKNSPKEKQRKKTSRVKREISLVLEPTPKKCSGYVGFANLPNQVYR